jgi:tRNA threonylcarbamoyladenosine biosynthesis protein TsaE
MTRAIAAKIARTLKPPITLALDGDLGAGKTTFVTGLVQGLSPDKIIRVQSPTFALARSYPTTPPVHHIDLYRLHGDEADLEDLGIENLLDDENAIVCIEWPHHRQNPLPVDVIWVRISCTGANTRTIELTEEPKLL